VSVINNDRREYCGICRFGKAAGEKNIICRIGPGVPVLIGMQEMPSLQAPGGLHIPAQSQPVINTFRPVLSADEWCGQFKPKMDS
jgi:hypothetical protein